MARRLPRFEPLLLGWMLLRPKLCWAWCLLAGSLSACRPPLSVPAEPTPKSGVVAARPSAKAVSSAVEVSRSSDQALVTQVAQLRRLPAREPVRQRRLDRQAAIAHIIAMNERNLPREVLEAQGETLTALGLIPATFDFAQGLYRLIAVNIAGFYDPHADTMFLLDDLPEAVQRETLAHELVHALQDQHYNLGRQLRWRRGHGDRLSAVHGLAEGDATFAMLELSGAAGAVVSARQIRLMMSASIALSEGGADIPRVLQAALAASYVDGFAFVQGLHKAGGWAAVDAAWRQPPRTTEQLLHLAKYQSREPALDVAAPSLLMFGKNWEARDVDSFGEQGLRLVLEQWTDNARAAAAAAGWGGDRYLTAVRRDDDGGREIVFAWRLRFDSTADALQMAEVLRKRFGVACRRRPSLGPITWDHQADRIALVADFARDAVGKARLSPLPCITAQRWAAQMVRDDDVHD